MSVECDACEVPATQSVRVLIDHIEVSNRKACVDHIAHPWKLNIGQWVAVADDEGWHTISVHIEKIKPDNIFEPLGRLGFGEEESDGK